MTNDSDQLLPMIQRPSISSDLAQAATWLKEIGVDFEHSRFSQYQNHLMRAEEGKIALDGYDSAIEASDLFLIYRGLSRFEHPALLQKLRIFVEKGPVHSKFERPSDASALARNTGLELLIASHFALAGFDLDFELTSDIVFRDKNSTFHIECKRPFRRETVKRCLEKAYSQLRHRYRDNPQVPGIRGLVVLSMGKFSNPENRTLGIANNQDLMSFMTKLQEDFLRMHQRAFYKNLHQNTMGVFAYLQIAVSFKNIKGTGIHRQFNGMYLSKTNETNIKFMNPDRLYFHQIVRNVNRSNWAAMSL